MTGDQRRVKRRHLIYYLRVMEQDLNEVIGYLVDITTHGIMIMSESPIDPGVTMKLKVLLQTDMSEKEYLNFGAKCKWCKKSINDISYDVGFELLDVSGDDFKDIEQIISELGFND